LILGAALLAMAGIVFIVGGVYLFGSDEEAETTADDGREER
jgi:hypothetical protein